MRTRSSVIVATGVSVILVVRSISKSILEEQMFDNLAAIAEIRAEYVNSVLNEFRNSQYSYVFFNTTERLTAALGT